jgi:hypothetical protein
MSGTPLGTQPTEQSISCVSGMYGVTGVPMYRRDSSRELPMPAALRSYMSACLTNNQLVAHNACDPCLQLCTSLFPTGRFERYTPSETPYTYCLSTSATEKEPVQIAWTTLCAPSISRLISWRLSANATLGGCATRGFGRSLRHTYSRTLYPSVGKWDACGRSTNEHEYNLLVRHTIQYNGRTACSQCLPVGPDRTTSL